MSTLTYGQLEGVWIAAGGDPGAAATMAAIAYPESGANPSSIQQGQPYATTGWGLWQITPGNSVPSVGTNQQLLDPFTNAKAAVVKYNASKARSGNGFLPWTTYTSGKYKRYLQSGVPPTTQGVMTGGQTISATLTSATGSTDGSSGSTANGDPTCLVGWNISVLGGNTCLITKVEMRAVVGSVLILAGGLVGLMAILTLVKSDLSALNAKPLPTLPTPSKTGTAGQNEQKPGQTEQRSTNQPTSTRRAPARRTPRRTASVSKARSTARAAVESAAVA